METISEKKGNKKLYLVEITRDSWDGDYIRRGYWAKSPSIAVRELLKIFSHEKGYTVWVMRFKILSPGKEERT